MADAPLLSWHPPRAVLELTELVVTGVLDGYPVPVVPPGAPDGAPAGAPVVLQDAEGTPVATLVDGRPEPAQPFTHGPLRSRRRAPDQLRNVAGGLAVPVTGPLTSAIVRRVVQRATATNRAVLWLVVVGAGRAGELSPEGLVRAVQGAAEDAAGRGAPGTVVAAAVPRLDGVDDARLLADVAAGFGAAEVLLPDELLPDELLPDELLPDELLPDELLPDELLPDEPGDGTPGWHPASARELERSDRPPDRRGVTVLFTGLSGSGKSTLARGLAERLLDDGRRAVSLLDGDEVRRLLSHGLGFSRADRDLNIRRIGFVAAEITRHGGLAICAPIAPFDDVRQEVRERISQVGDVVLVHVDTPLAECERRDRKGLYARARQGLIPDFTGISSPYQPPADADLRIDTTHLSEDAAVDLVWDLLLSRGYLGPAST
jgi:sulfate adenylyltransferase